MSYANESLVYAQLRSRDRQLGEHIKTHKPDSATFKDIYNFVSSLARAYRRMEDPANQYIVEGKMEFWLSALGIGYPDHPLFDSPSLFERKAN